MMINLLTTEQIRKISDAKRRSDLENSFGNLKQNILNFIKENSQSFETDKLLTSASSTGRLSQAGKDLAKLVYGQILRSVSAPVTAEKFKKIMEIVAGVIRDELQIVTEVATERRAQLRAINLVIRSISARFSLDEEKNFDHFRQIFETRLLSAKPGDVPSMIEVTKSWVDMQDQTSLAQILNQFEDHYLKTSGYHQQHRPLWIFFVSAARKIHLRDKLLEFNFPDDVSAKTFQFFLKLIGYSLNKRVAPSRLSQVYAGLTDLVKLDQNNPKLTKIGRKRLKNWLAETATLDQAALLRALRIVPEIIGLPEAKENRAYSFLISKLDQEIDTHQPNPVRTADPNQHKDSKREWHPRQPLRVRSLARAVTRVFLGAGVMGMSLLSPSNLSDADDQTTFRSQKDLAALLTEEPASDKYDPRYHPVIREVNEPDFPLEPHQPRSLSAIEPEIPLVPNFELGDVDSNNQLPSEGTVDQWLSPDLSEGYQTDAQPSLNMIDATMARDARSPDSFLPFPDQGLNQTHQAVGVRTESRPVPEPPGLSDALASSVPVDSYFPDEGQARQNPQSAISSDQIGFKSDNSPTPIPVEVGQAAPSLGAETQEGDSIDDLINNPDEFDLVARDRVGDLLTGWIGNIGGHFRTCEFHSLDSKSISESLNQSRVADPYNSENIELVLRAISNKLGISVTATSIPRGVLIMAFADGQGDIDRIFVLLVENSRAAQIASQYRSGLSTFDISEPVG